MQLADDVVVALGLHGDTDAGVERALADGLLRLPVTALANHHVTAVSASPVEVAASGGVLLDRRDHLEKVAADRHEGILEPERADPGIDEARLDAEHAAEVVDDGLEFVGDQGDLPQLDGHEVLLSRSLERWNRRGTRGNAPAGPL